MQELLTVKQNVGLLLDGKRQAVEKQKTRG